MGERHDPETHLIPLVPREAPRVKRGGDPAATALRVYGDDFDTPDGTCVRDYATRVTINDPRAMHGKSHPREQKPSTG